MVARGFDAVALVALQVVEPLAVVRRELEPKNLLEKELEVALRYFKVNLFKGFKGQFLHTIT